MKRLLSSNSTKTILPSSNGFRKSFNIFYKQRHMQAMAIPGVIFLIIFSYLPMYGILIAFKNYRPIFSVWESPWASNYGLEHFINFFLDGSLIRVIRNTLTLSFLSLVITFPIPIIFALFLNEIRSLKFKRMVQTLTYFPHFISWVILGGILLNWLSEGGMINDILISLGISETDVIFLAESKYFYLICILTSIWKETGWSAIIYLAAISGIDTTLYEAATIDGAGRLKKALYVTLPSIKPTVVLLLIFAIAYVFGNNFDQILVLRNPLNQEVSDVIDIYVYRQGIQGMRYSMATAIGLFRSVVNVALLVSANWLAKKLTGTSLY